MIYIMRRTQLYLEEETWGTLQVLAHQSGVTVSELVRQAVRERYLGRAAMRKKAMAAFVGSGAGDGGKDIPDTEAYIRKLRKGTRVQRLSS